MDNAAYLAVQKWKNKKVSSAVARWESSAYNAFKHGEMFPLVIGPGDP